MIDFGVNPWHEFIRSIQQKNINLTHPGFACRTTRSISSEAPFPSRSSGLCSGPAVCCVSVRPMIDGVSAVGRAQKGHNKSQQIDSFIDFVDGEAHAPPGQRNSARSEMAGSKSAGG